MTRWRLLGLLLLAPPAAALGPMAPFTPPRSAALEAAAERASVNGATPVPDMSGLAGVRLSRQPMALIDGQWWALGSTPRGAQLVAVGRRGALLRHTDGRREELLLAPEALWTARPPGATKGPVPGPAAPPASPRIDKAQPR